MDVFTLALNTQDVLIYVLSFDWVLLKMRGLVVSYCRDRMSFTFYPIGAQFPHNVSHINCVTGDDCGFATKFNSFILQCIYRWIWLWVRVVQWHRNAIYLALWHSWTAREVPARHDSGEMYQCHSHDRTSGRKVVSYIWFVIKTK